MLDAQKFHAGQPILYRQAAERGGPRNTARRHAARRAPLGIQARPATATAGGADPDLSPRVVIGWRRAPGRKRQQCNQRF
jgi:hypothetical protein